MPWSYTFATRLFYLRTSLSVSFLFVFVFVTLQPCAVYRNILNFLSICWWYSKWKWKYTYTNEQRCHSLQVAPCWIRTYCTCMRVITDMIFVLCTNQKSITSFSIYVVVVIIVYRTVASQKWIMTMSSIIWSTESGLCVVFGLNNNTLTNIGPALRLFNLLCVLLIISSVIIIIIYTVAYSFTFQCRGRKVVVSIISNGCNKRGWHTLLMIFVKSNIWVHHARLWSNAFHVLWRCQHYRWSARHRIIRLL